MRNLFILVFVICFFGCGTTSQKQQLPLSSTTIDQNFSDRIFVEIHNTESHCLVRIWNLEISDETPQAVFRGTVGNDTCRIYNIINPGIEGTNGE